MSSPNSSVSAGKGTDHDRQSTCPEKGDWVTAESDGTNSEWAENWFAGKACCPACGGDDMQIVRANADDSTRIEDWCCASGSCRSRWRVELRESALGIYRDTDGIEATWYERDGNAATFRILVEDGIVTAIRPTEASARLNPFPQFIVREYDRRRPDGDRLTGTDAQGRDYYEYGLSETAEVEANPAEMHSVLVASTAHVTVQEAQVLTERGYSRGEYGWLLCVGLRGISVVPELEAASEGLSGVIRQARARGCRYVLLDRDADPLNGVPTYN
jgi:hypothetical protein